VKSLADIKGKKVRTASRTQAELVEALGGTPVTMSFGEVVPAMQNKVVDCGITGTLSGNFAKWYEVSTHLIPLPVSWGQMVFAVNLQTWAKTDPKVRAFIEREIKTLERGVWDAVAFDSQDGIDCNTGKATCKQGTKANMKLVEVSAADRAMLKKLVNDVIVPKWAARCSADCVRNWNETVGPIVGLQAKK
jgi:TRAP-type C4-dicarboxylate transport system substrate-binding protein